MIGARRLVLAVVAAVVCWLPAAAALVAAPQGDEAVDRLLFEATQLERDGDLEGALQKFELLSEQFPRNPAAAEALLRLVVGNRGLERDDAAERAAETLIRDHPRSPHAAGAYVLLGQLGVERAEDEEDLDEAGEMFENAVLLYPRATYAKQPWRGEAVVRGARVSLRRGRDADAARALVEVIDLEPRSRWTAAARLEFAGLLLEQGDWRRAGALLQEVLDGVGESDDEQLLAALAASRLGLAHRLGLRPDSGQERWLGSRVVGTAPDKPSAVAAGPDGLVAVSGAKGTTVVVGADGGRVSLWNHEEARQNSWNGSELVVATAEAAATFPDRRNLRFAAPPSEKKPTIRPLVAVEAAPFGRWLVIAAKPPRAMLYQSGRRLRENLVAGKGHEPVDATSDRRGRLLVLDQKARSVTRFAAGDTSGERLIAGGWDRAGALAVDPVGNIYVLDRGKRRIEVFDRDGKRLTALGPALPGGLELDRPADLTVDGAGRIWIADTKVGLIVVE